MLSDAIIHKNKPRFTLYGEGTKEISNSYMMSWLDSSTPVDEQGDSLIVYQATVYPESEDYRLVRNQSFGTSQESFAIRASLALDYLRREPETPSGFWMRVANPGYAVPTGATRIFDRIEAPIPSGVGFSATYPFCALNLRSPQRVVQNSRNDNVLNYLESVLRYGSEALELESEPPPDALLIYESIDAIINVISKFGDERIADRLDYLASEEILEEGDTPVSLEVCNDFLDFFKKLDNDAHLNLTCARGWLCAEWDFQDGEAVILWFMGRGEVRMTVLGNEGNLVDINEGQQVTDRLAIMQNLVRAGYFTCRNRQSNDVNLRPATT